MKNKDSCFLLQATTLDTYEFITNCEK